MLENVLTGFIISVALGVIAFRNDALSKSGTLAAILVGTVSFCFGGPGWFGLLAVFFLTSLFFTRFKAKEKGGVVQEFAKGGVRDFWQVLANGGVAALLATAYFYYHHLIFFYAFAGVIATVTADTWATEIGITGSRKPRLITNGLSVPVGTSGAISFGGAVSAAAGAFAIGLTVLLFDMGPAWIRPTATLPSPILFLVSIMIAGLLGSLSDSYLGATLQAMYYCTKCKRETERLIHYCGERTVAIRGMPWFDNDLVNLASSMFGAIVAAGLYYVLG